MSQKIESKEERPLQSFWLKAFLAVDTTDSRIAPPNNSCFYDLTNAQPLGFSNLHSVRDISEQLYDFGESTIYRTFNVNTLGIEYLILAGQDGTLWAYVVDTSGEVPGANPIGPNGYPSIVDGEVYRIDDGNMATDMSAVVCQYDYTTALVLDSSNYWHWSGPLIQTSEGLKPQPIAKVGTANGAPVGGEAITVYNSMVWIAQGRLLYFSKAGVASDSPPGYSDFSTANGGGYSVMSDATLRSNVKALFAANGYLYVFGESSIDVISDVYIPQGVSTPSFTRLNVSAVVGTDQVDSIMTYKRLVLFANKYGFWKLYGTTVETLSGQDPNSAYLSTIDGTVQYLTFDHYVAGRQWINNSSQTVGWENNSGQQVFWQMASSVPYLQTISGGQVISNKLLCAAFLVVRKNDPVFGSGTFILMYQADAAGGKWWSALYTAAGELTHIHTAFVDQAPALFGMINNQLYQLFAVAVSSPASRILTSLWDFGDPISAKQALRAGIRVSIYGGDPAAAQINVFLDTLRNSFPVDLGHVGAIQWVNNQYQSVGWVNGSGNDVYWISPVPYLNYNGKAPECFSPYLGFRVTTEQGTVYELNQFSLDYKLAQRWVGE